MELKIQKRLAGQILKCSAKRVVFDSDRLEDIKESITKADIRTLINNKAITKKPVKSISKVRARKRRTQKIKGRQKGDGSRKGKYTARNPKKRAWINKVRTQRDLIKTLRDKDLITKSQYRMLYLKVKGGFFRSRRHIKLYLEEHGMIKK